MRLLLKSAVLFVMGLFLWQCGGKAIVPSTPSLILRDLTSRSSVYTNSPTVMVEVISLDGVAGFLLTEQAEPAPGAADPRWTAVLPDSTQFVFSNEDNGEKRLHLFFKDGEGRLLRKYASASIILDTRPPADPQIRLQDPRTDSMAITNSQTVEVFITPPADERGLRWLIQDAPLTGEPDEKTPGWRDNPPTTHTLTSGEDGYRKVMLWVLDQAGNRNRNPAEATIYLDLTGTDDVTITMVDTSSGSNEYTNDHVVDLSITGDDGATAWLFTEVDEAAPDADDPRWQVTRPSQYAFALPAPRRLKLWLWTKDGARNVSGPARGEMIYDPDPPVAPSFFLHDLSSNDASLTNERTVKVEAHHPEPFVSFYISEDTTPPTEQSTGWTGQSPALYTLSPGESSTRTVHLWTRDRAGNVGPMATWTIWYDPQVPVPPTLTLSDLSSRSGQYTNEREVALVASHQESALKWIIRQEQRAPWEHDAEWMASPPDRIVLKEGNDGPRPIHAWVMDRAGNISQPATYSIVLKRSRPPDPQLRLEDPLSGSGLITNSQSVALLINSPGAARWLIGTGASTPAENDPGWLNTPPATHTFPDSLEGLKGLKLWVRDAAGNSSLNPGEAAILYDSSAPVFKGLKRARALDAGQILLTWEPAEDVDPEISYLIYMDQGLDTFTPLATTTDSSFIVTGFADQTQHRFMVRASDRSGFIDANRIEKRAIPFSPLTAVNFQASLWELTSCDGAAPPPTLTAQQLGGEAALFLANGCGGARFNVPEALHWSGYEVTGRLRSAPGGVVEIRILDDGNAHFSMVAPMGGTVQLGARGTGYSRESSEPASVLLPDSWYQFRIRAEDTQGRTEIKARLWPAGVPESAVWHRQAFSHRPDRSRSGTFGIHLREGCANGAHFNDLNVSAVAEAAPEVQILSLSPVFATAGEVIGLSGSVNDRDGHIISSIWKSDLDGILGEGANRQISLSAGVHRLLFTAVDSSGKAASDERVVLLNGPGILMPATDFEAYGYGDHPLGWKDYDCQLTREVTPSTHIVEHAGGRAVGARGHSCVASLFEALAADSWSNYAVTGRFLVTPYGMVGISVFNQHRNGNAARYYLNAHHDGSVEVKAVYTELQLVQVNTLPVAAGNWYRFRIEAHAKASQTTLKIKIWPDALQPEPAGWNIEATDGSPTRLSAGPVGLLIGTAQEASSLFDDLAVTTLMP